MSPFFRNPASAETSKKKQLQSGTHIILSMDKTCIMLYNHTVPVSSFGFGSNYAASEFQQQSADNSRIALG